MSVFCPHYWMQSFSYFSTVLHLRIWPLFLLEYLCFYEIKVYLCGKASTLPPRDSHTVESLHTFLRGGRHRTPLLTGIMKQSKLSLTSSLELEIKMCQIEGNRKSGYKSRIETFARSRGIEVI